MANIKDNAVIAFSPPLRATAVLTFLPKGLASIITPPSKGLSSTSRRSCAVPSGDISENISEKFEAISLNVLRKTSDFSFSTS